MSEVRSQCPNYLSSLKSLSLYSQSFFFFFFSFCYNIVFLLNLLTEKSSSFWGLGGKYDIAFLLKKIMNSLAYNVIDKERKSIFDNLMLEFWLSTQTASSAIKGAIQLGIGYTVGNLTSKPDRDVLMQDFYVVESVFLPR